MGNPVQRIKIRAIGENANIVLFVGRKYYGKSYLAKTLLKNVSQYIIWDENEEYLEYGTIAVSYTHLTLPTILLV